MSTDVLGILLRRHPELAVCTPGIDASFQTLKNCFEQGGKLLLCGNGGSAADCEHIVGELLKGFHRDRPVPQNVCNALESAYGTEGKRLALALQGGLPCLSLVSQTAFLTAYANDVAAEYCFAQQVYVYGKPGDALLAISTSGNSPNVIYALQVARMKGMVTLGLTGKSGGKFHNLCDAVICVPADDTATIQELHLPVYHVLCTLLEEAFFT